VPARQLEAEVPEPRPEAEVPRAEPPWAEVALLPPWRAAVPQQLPAAEELPQLGVKERSWRWEVARPPKPLSYWKKPFARA
jgi:hypothetical protein